MKLNELSKKALMEEVNLLQSELLKHETIEEKIRRQMEANEETRKFSLATAKRNIELGSVLGDVYKLTEFELTTSKQELRNKLKQIRDITKKYVMPDLPKIQKTINTLEKFKEKL